MTENEKTQTETALASAAEPPRSEQPRHSAVIEAHAAHIAHRLPYTQLALDGMRGGTLFEDAVRELANFLYDTDALADQRMERDLVEGGVTGGGIFGGDPIATSMDDPAARSRAASTRVNRSFVGEFEGEGPPDESKRLPPHRRERLLKG